MLEEVNPWSDLARAIFAQAVIDLYDKQPPIVAQAYAWLLEDGLDSGWRDLLAEAADINLEALQSFVSKEQPVDLLKKLAKKLKRGIEG